MTAVSAPAANPSFCFILRWGAISNGTSSVAWAAKMQLHKQLPQCKQCGGNLWAPGDRAAPWGSLTGEPHHHQGPWSGSGGTRIPSLIWVWKIVLPIPFRITAGSLAGAFPVPRLSEGLSRIREKSSYFPQHTFFWQWVKRCLFYRWKTRGKGQ